MDWLQLAVPPNRFRRLGRPPRNTATSAQFSFAPSVGEIGPVERNPVVENESVEQHGESCAFVLITTGNAEIAAYTFNK
jgi:hypothetical protein